MQSCSSSATLTVDKKRYFLTEQNNVNNNLCFAESHRTYRSEGSGVHILICVKELPHKLG